MRSLGVVLVVIALGCGSDTPVALDDAGATAEPRELGVGSLLPPPPENLLVLADEIRMAGGSVFVGSVGPATDTEPARAEAFSDLWVEYPQHRGTVTVEDDLGGDWPADVAVVASSGEPPVLTDAAGAPAEGWVVSGLWDPSPHRLLEPAGRGVWFVVRENLVWRTDVVGSDASGAGTQDETDVPLDDLRLAM
jgi:hypothetical protein